MVTGSVEGKQRGKLNPNAVRLSGEKAVPAASTNVLAGLHKPGNSGTSPERRRSAGAAPGPTCAPRAERRGPPQPPLPPAQPRAGAASAPHALGRRTRFTRARAGARSPQPYALRRPWRGLAPRSDSQRLLKAPSDPPDQFPIPLAETGHSLCHDTAP